MQAVSKDTLPVVGRHVVDSGRGQKDGDRFFRVPPKIALACSAGATLPTLLAML